MDQADQDSLVKKVTVATVEDQVVLALLESKETGVILESLVLQVPLPPVRFIKVPKESLVPQAYRVLQVRRVSLVFQETPEFQDRMDGLEHLDLQVPKEILDILEALAPQVDQEQRERWVKWDSLDPLELKDSQVPQEDLVHQDHPDLQDFQEIRETLALQDMEHQEIQDPRVNLEHPAFQETQDPKDLQVLQAPQASLVAQEQRVTQAYPDSKDHLVFLVQRV